MNCDPVVHILTSDEALRRALLAHIAVDERMSVSCVDADTAARGDVVVAPTSDLPLDRCGEISAAGARVIVLAAIPTQSERARYLAAGAFAYMPMAMDTHSLPAQIRKAVASRAGAAPPHPGWFLLSDHGLVLLYLGLHPDAVPATIAEAANIPQDHVRRIIKDLEASDYVHQKRVGRSPHYALNPDARFVHPALAGLRIGDVVKTPAASL